MNTVRNIRITGMEEVVVRLVEDIFSEISRTVGHELSVSHFFAHPRT